MLQLLRRHATVVSFIALGVLYLLTVRRFYVGHFADDARDILAGWSLLHGSYRDLQNPAILPLRFPLPGFPLFLAPWTALWINHPGWLRVVPWILTVLDVFLLDRLLRRHLQSRARIAVLFLFALNPTTVLTSGRVISDAFYLSLQLSALLVLDNSSTSSARRILLLSALSAWAAITRPEGFLFVMALGISLWQARQRKGAVWVTTTGLLPIVAFFLRNFLLLNSGTGYADLWARTLPAIANHPLVLFQNAAETLRSLVVDLLIGQESFGLPLVVSGFVLAAAITAVGVGAYARTPMRATRPALVVAGLYVVLHLVLHAMWLAVDAHYLWPILPYCLWFVGEGSAVTARRTPQRWGIVVSLALLGTVYGQQELKAIIATRRYPNATPKATFNWLRMNTPASSYVLSPQASALTLYANRYSLAMIDVANSDAFYVALLRAGVTHIAARDIHFLFVQTGGVSADEGWRLIRRWADQERDRYRIVARLPADETTIYEVAPDSATLVAYSLSERARRCFENGEWNAGFELVEDSIRVQPLATAMNAYGVSSLLSGQRLARADKLLLAAMYLRPGFTQPWFTRARLAAFRQNPELAKALFQEANRRSATCLRSSQNMYPVLNGVPPT